MRAGRGTGPDSGLVSAARSGDPQALEGLLSQSLPLVYNIVGRSLDGHPDTDDVVQETLLRVVRGLGDLEQPASYRSWMVAIAVRQIRDWIRGQQRTRETRAGMDDAELVADPASDFTSLTILQLGLTDQRREVAEATRWLDPDDRELLSLWWLEETGELSRADTAAALGLSGRHTAVRVQRMKEQIDTGRTLVRALGAQPPCGGLAEVAAGWDGVPSPLWRKRLARHVRDCAQCADDGRRGALLPMERLLGGLPLLVPPAALHHAVLTAVLTSGQLGSAVTELGGHAGTAGHAGTGPDATGPGSGPGSGSGSGSGDGGGSSAARHGSRAARRHRASAARPRSTLLMSGSAAGAVAVVAAGVLVATHLTGAHSTAAVVGPAASATHAVTSGAPATAPTSASAKPSRSASPSPSRSAKPSASASASPSRKAAAPPPVPAAPSGKKGVGVWSFPGVSPALAQSGASWYYTWSTGHDGISTPAGADFVPMIWGPGSVTASALAQAKAEGPYLLGFNEPDNSGQSNMTVDQALSLWPQLEAAGKILGSPAVSYGGDTPGGWLDRFMTGAQQRGYRVDFIALHWYGGDFTTTDAVSQLRSYLTAVWNRYHKPIWLTEYALTDFSTGTARFPTDAQQAAFVTASTKMLASLSFVQRYAWFGLGTTGTAPATVLFRSGPAVTPEGRAFEAAP